MKDIKVENELNPNSPELHGKDNRQPWVSLGFCSEEDYECHMRRMGDRSKPAPTDPYKKSGNM